MSEYPSILLEQAVNQMSSLPGVGRRTALRLVLHLLRQSDEQVEAFAGAFTRLKKEVVYCRECHNIERFRGCGKIFSELLSQIRFQVCYMR